MTCDYCITLGSLHADGCPAIASQQRIDGDGAGNAYDSPDATAPIRAAEIIAINTNADPDRVAAEAKHGQVWTTAQLQTDFVVLGFMAPYVVVRRVSDGKMGSLQFQHSPRFYFNWKED